MASPTERLERSARLRQSKDFQRVARYGTRVASRDFVLLVAARVPGAAEGPSRRLGVTASRKVGPAVLRNRVKRSIREWFRRHREELSEHVDVVVIARRGSAELPSAQIAADLRVLAQRTRSGAGDPTK
jgi:ribonuclease P protein component